MNKHIWHSSSKMFMSCQNSRKHDHRAQINQFPVLSCDTRHVFFYLSVGLSMFQCHSKDHLTGSANNSLTFHGISWHPLATTVPLFNQIPSFNHLWKRNSPLCDPPFFHLGVSKNRGTPTWMVYNGKPYSNGMIWGYPYFWKHPFLSIHILKMHLWAFISQSISSEPSFAQLSSLSSFPSLLIEILVPVPKLNSPRHYLQIGR